MCFDLSTTFASNFSRFKSNLYTVMDVLQSSCKVTIILVRGLKKLEFSGQIFEKFPSIKFHVNRSSGSRIVSIRKPDRQTDMTKLIISFCNFAKVPKNEDSQRPISGYTLFLVTHVAFASVP
jgi:hypothetical protein